MTELVGIESRKITVSTSGIAPVIPRLAEGHPTRLALSLHAPNDALRSQIMPINRTYPLSTVLEACKQYIDALPKTWPSKRVTFEYTLLRGVNDSEGLARELGVLLRDRIGIRASHVNLLPFNEWAGAPYKPTPMGQISAFRRILEEEFGIPATIRESRGKDIMAACGQLKSAFAELLK